MKKIIIIVLSCLVLAVALCFTLIYTANPIPELSSEKVEIITVMVQGNSEEPQLDADDTETFIALFNKSLYKGKARPVRTTAEYIARVYFKDGSYMAIGQSVAYKRNFYVLLYDADDSITLRCDVYNQELEDYLENSLFEKLNLVYK